MKTLLLLLFSSCLWYILPAQDLPCDTLVLGNGKERLVRIDSISEDVIYYRKCPDSTNQTYQLKRIFVRQIIRSGSIRPGSILREGNLSEAKKQQHIAIRNCDQLLMASDERKFVIVDSLSISKLFYTTCDEYSKSESISHFQVNKIIENTSLRASGHRSSKQIACFNAFRLKSTKGKWPRQSRLQRWFFKKATKSMAKKLDKGMKVTVVYRDLNLGTKQKIKGYLEGIDAQYLMIRRGSQFKIPKATIIKIKYPRKFALGQKILGASAVLIGLSGLVIIGGIFFLQLIFSAGQATPSTASSTSKEELGFGCLIPALILVGGLLAFIFTKPNEIKKPFHGEWQIEQVFASDQGDSAP